MTARLTAMNLATLFRNSVRPRTPKIRCQPSAGEIREKSGRSRSKTMRGAFCAIEAATPAPMRMTKIGTNSGATAISNAWHSAVKSAPLRSRHPLAWSSTPASVEAVLKLPSSRKKAMITNRPPMKAKIVASRETGTLPRSTSSRSFFSVGCSVLLSLSPFSAMPAYHLVIRSRRRRQPS